MPVPCRNFLKITGELIPLSWRYSTSSKMRRGRWNWRSCLMHAAKFEWEQDLVGLDAMAMGVIEGLGREEIR
jgi:hypothetical protein